MKRTEQIANRFREVILNGFWIANTNFKHQVSELSWEQATQKIASLNTIATLCLHVDYYIAGLVDFFEGGSLEIKDKFSFDFPPIQSQEDWDNRLNKMWDNAERFALLVEQMPDEKLAEVFVEEKYGNYERNIEAMIEHSYYHLGQVSLIKKMILESTELKEL